VGLIASVGVTVKRSVKPAVLPAPSLADTVLAPAVKVGTVPVAVKLPLLSTTTPETNGLVTLGVTEVSIKPTSAVTPAPLKPVPATVTLVPTAPFLVAGEVTTTFGCTVKLGVVVEGATLTPSVTVIRCSPAVAVGINIANVIGFPEVSVVIVVGEVVIVAPSNLATKTVLAGKLDATTVTDAPTGPLPVAAPLRVILAATALAGTAAIATRLPRITSTASSFTIFVFILI
jgi:hypothetical protein